MVGVGEPTFDSSVADGARLHLCCITPSHIPDALAMGTVECFLQSRYDDGSLSLKTGLLIVVCFGLVFFLIIIIIYIGLICSHGKYMIFCIKLQCSSCRAYPNQRFYFTEKNPAEDLPVCCGLFPVVSIEPFCCFLAELYWLQVLQSSRVFFSVPANSHHFSNTDGQQENHCWVFCVVFHSCFS